MKSPQARTISAATTTEGMTAIGPKECPRSSVRNKFLKFMAPAVTSDLQNIHHAETKAAAREAIKVFTEKYGPNPALPLLA